MKYIDDVKQNLTDSNQELYSNEHRIIELQLRIQNVTKLIVEFGKIQTEIEIVDDDNFNNANQREVFESLYYKAVTAASHLLSKLQPNEATNIPNQEIDEIRNRADYVGGVKLPIIYLPKFNGSFDNCWSFEIHIAR